MNDSSSCFLPPSRILLSLFILLILFFSSWHTRTRLYCVYIYIYICIPVSLTLDKHLHEFKTAARKLVESKEQQAHLEIPQDRALILGTSFLLPFLLALFSQLASYDYVLIIVLSLERNLFDPQEKN